ncbi:1146_t:CDS:2 [Entrophospora sp. SA101]|nr:1146_t:CDS:2 [Entrophospora sp. SA101]
MEQTLPISVQPNRRILISKLDPDQSSFNHNAPVGPYEPAIFDYNKRINVTNQNNNTTTRATISIDDKVLVPSLVDNDLETQRKNSLLSILQPTKSIASSSSNAAAVINKQLENHNKNIEYIHQINSSSNSNPLYNKILQSPSLYNNSNNINSYYNNNNIYYNNNNHALLLNPMTIPHPIQDTSANNALYEEIKAQERQLLDWITTQIYSEIYILLQYVDDMAIGIVVGYNEYGEYGEYGNVTPTEFWEKDGNDGGHEYSCTKSKLHPYSLI